jgi:SAM-dependent methyltransferase
VTDSETSLYDNGTIGNSHEDERERLRLLETLADPITLDVINALHKPTDLRFLEVGAGGGSVARWLAKKFPNGHVVATDIDTTHLSDRQSNLSGILHDVAKEEFPESSFDLIHARAVLCHLRTADEVLAKLARWTAADGWVFVEDPVFNPLGLSTHPAVRQVVKGISALLPSPEDWARTLPRRMARVGLTDIGCRPWFMTIGNGGPADDLWRGTVARAGPALIARGLAGEQDIREANNCLSDPTFVDVPWAFMSAWGRRRTTR